MKMHLGLLVVLAGLAMGQKSIFLTKGLAGLAMGQKGQCPNNKEQIDKECDSKGGFCFPRFCPRELVKLGSCGRTAGCNCCSKPVKDGTKYLYHMPSTIFDLKEVSSSRQSSRSQNVNVTSHTDGYSTSSGACVSATLGVTATAHIEVTITATSQKNIQTLGNTIKEHLKESFKEKFDEEYNAGYSLDVGWDWTGVSSNGDVNESAHEEAYEEGEEGMEMARTEFTQAVQEQNSKTVTIVGDATLEGTSPIPAEYCIYFAVQKVQFTDGSEMYVVNDNQRTAKTATGDGKEVPNKSLKLTVVPGT